MEDVLDFLKTPEGQGLLSAAFGGLAGARRGRPLNTIGQAGMAGLLGYSSALDRGQKTAFQNAQMEQLKQHSDLYKQQVAQAQMEMEQRNRFANELGNLMPQLNAPQSIPYQDQITPQMVGSTSMPTAKPDKGDVSRFVSEASQIANPVERTAALESIFRQNPELRPQVQNPARMDAATALASLGMRGAISGVKGADSLVSGAKYFEPQKMDAGAFYRNPMNGQREFIPQVEKGMTFDDQGRASNVPGYVSSLAQQEGAKTGAQKAASAPYDEPVVLKGAGANGSDLIIPRVNLPNLSGTLQSRSQVSVEGEKDLNKVWMDKTFIPIQEAGRNSESILSQVQTLRQIPLNTGWGTEARAGAANVLSGLGIAPKNAEMFAANEQKFQQVASERLWTVLNAAKGPQTEGDAARAQKTFAKVSNTPEANQFILDLAEATSRRDMQRAGYYTDASQLAKQDGNYTKIDTEWRKIQRSVWDDPIMQKWKQQ